MAGKAWTEHEDAVIRDYYPQHGHKWDAWVELLPGRTSRSIAIRASKLRVREVTEMAHSYRARDADVMSYMKMGLTPSEIDGVMKLRRGTAHDIMVELWMRDTERFGPGDKS